MSEEIITIVDLLRHGAPEGGVRYRGSLDDPLSDEGWRQMQAAVAGHCPWNVIVSSPLMRCAAFARKLAACRELALEIEPGFREIGFGDWEGRTVAEIMTQTPEALSLFWNDPLNNPPPGGESLADCGQRVTAAWDTLLERHAGDHVLVVGHGGMIRLVIAHLLELPLPRLWRLEVPYATFTRVRVYGRGAQAEPLLVFHGKGLE